MISRPNYTDAIAGKVVGADLLWLGFDVVEVKHDGRWAVITIGPSGVAVITSRTGRRQGELVTDLRPELPIVLLGEQMIGTERAKAAPGAMVIFDCLHTGAHDITGRMLHARRKMAADIVAQLSNSSWTMIEQHSLCDRSFADIWREVVAEQGHEGLVAKRSRDSYSHGPHNWPHWIRIKETIEHDGLVTGIDGGSLLCNVDGVIWRVAAGLSGQDVAALVGLKVTLRSNGLHRSGKGRHARFVRVHPEQ